jgi:hypothetical protein
MNTKSLALALIGIMGFAAIGQAQTIKLSDVPPGAIHTPGIGPGYMYPAYPIAAMGVPSDASSGTAMMPGAMPVDQMPASTVPARPRSSQPTGR